MRSISQTELGINWRKVSYGSGDGAGLRATLEDLNQQLRSADKQPEEWNKICPNLP